MLEQITKAEWDAIHPDYKSVWTTERTDWPNWAEVRDQYMGKRTLMRGGSLGVEGISFEIVEEAKPQRPPRADLRVWRHCRLHGRRWHRGCSVRHGQLPRRPEEHRQGARIVRRPG